MKIFAAFTSLCISPALLLGFQYQKKPTVSTEQTTSSQQKSTPTQSSSECLSPLAQRVELKHIESKGIGYHQGYSTLEGFFTFPSSIEGSWVPFLDIRAHMFNNGKPAVNGGLGLRYVNSRVYGVNTYYDYRKTHRFHYNQVGFGLESLGKLWDFRLNAYFPVGKKDSKLFQTHFHAFKNHSIILSSKKEIAMKGANAEVAAHALRKENYKIYAGIGPYYFEREGQVAWGGQGRIAFSAFDYIRLQLSGSYDKIFKGVVQGEIALTYSFGGKKKIKPRNGRSCTDQNIILERALQRVDRQEIIVVDRKRQKSKAINPATGTPYTVWFVDNTSHSLGTYESPFNTLANAQTYSGINDVIYVFPGDGTDKGMNAGITLKHGQQLLGAGIVQQVQTTLGSINIPAQATGLPLITNTFSTATIGRSCVVMNAGNNVVSGFNLLDTVRTGTTGTDFTAAVRIETGLNYLIKNNILTSGASLVEGGNCFNLHGGGNVTVSNNTFYNLDASDTFGVDTFAYVAPLQGYFVFENNLFTGVNANSGLDQGIHFEVRSSGSAGIIGNLSFTAIGNTFNSQKNTANDSPTAIAINCTPSSSTTIFANVRGNNITIPAGITNPIAGMNVSAHGPGPLNISVHNNISITPTGIPGYRFKYFSVPAHLNLDFGTDNVGTVTIIP